MPPPPRKGLGVWGGLEVIRRKLRSLRKTSRIIGGPQHNKYKKDAFIQVNLRGELDGPASSGLNAIATLAINGDLVQGYAGTVAEAALGLIRFHAYEFHESGRLDESFFVDETMNTGATIEYDISSDQPYVATWTHAGDQGKPPTESIRDWMDTKGAANWTYRDEVVDGKELDYVAFLIARRIAKQKPPLSGTLHSLRPRGTRYYDYPKWAMRDLRVPLERIGIELGSILRDGFTEYS